MQISLAAFEKEVVIRIVFAIIAGGLIGLEREIKGRPAGLKTFSLVCLGSTLIMLTNEYVYQFVAGQTGDIVRMSAQVVSGIGFLGAGTIIVTGRHQIKGLTTAAALWVTAAIGIAIGSGFYFGSAAALIGLYVSSFLFRVIDNIIMEHSKIMSVYAEGLHDESMMKLAEYLGTNQIRVIGLQKGSENKWSDDHVCMTITVDLGRVRRHKTVIEEIRNIDGVCYAEEIV